MVKMEIMGFKENLKDELTYRGIQTKELAAITGISLNTLNHYLVKNSTSPNVENAVKIARALKVSVEYLVTGRNEKASKNSFPYNARIHQIADRLSKMTSKELSFTSQMIQCIENNWNKI